MDENMREKFMANYESIHRDVIPTEEIEAQFVKTENNWFISVGEIECTTGYIVASDPLACLPNEIFSVPLSRKIPTGKYPVDVSVCRREDIGIRMCTARLKISDKRPARYTVGRDVSQDVLDLNLATRETFPVDAGLMSFCDEQAAREYREFIDEWYKEHPEGNHYDDYFAAFFAESYEKMPAYQREEGDFICWENPKTGSHIVMIASGLGDGIYICYYGLDENHDVCQIIVPLVDPKVFE